MLFNSLQFAVFFIVVYSLYLVLNHKHQNRLLLVASYVFYGAWDWRFLSLLLFTTAVDYSLALKIEECADSGRKKRFLFLSIFCNLAVLGVFKYYDFFVSNLIILLHSLGFNAGLRYLHIILPVGISFYIFQEMSYTIDVYRGQLKATKSFSSFALFVSFFPQLVAGPIERAKYLLPQVLSRRVIVKEEVYKGAYLILWGLFQKVFVADNLAMMADRIFALPAPYNGAQVLVGLYAFAFQIYCDFAGYSDIARGLGKLMGFDIMLNFNLPYFATNPGDFWRRWHISLSSWVRDYLYIPLGGSRNGQLVTYRNIMITFILIGLWHGAAWKFVIWGAYFGALVIIYRLLKPVLAKIPPSGSFFMRKALFAIRVVFFFHIVCFGWLIFRAHSLEQVLQMSRGLFFNFHISRYCGFNMDMRKFIFFTGLLFVMQIFQFRKNDLMAIRSCPCLVRALFYLITVYSMIIFGVNYAQNFIYFQF